eukprot:s891_g5.t1
MDGSRQGRWGLCLPPRAPPHFNVACCRGTHRLNWILLEPLSVGLAKWCLDLFGGCLGLKQAYKQLARHPDDSWAAVSAVLNPEDRQVYFFEAVALPFGSVSSVLAFNCAARALRTILPKLFKLVVANFFDDFCQMELGLLSDSAWKTAELVMDLLGWKIFTGDDKRRPFARTFEILGAVISFPSEGNTSVKVSKKEPGLEQLKLQVKELKEASGTFGGMGPSVKVTAEPVHATSEALELLLGSKPRIVPAWDNAPPILVFTDGAVEEDMRAVTHGALLLDLRTGESFFFGGHIPDEICSMWRRSGKKQVIAQAEIFPVLFAKETWGEILEGRSVLWFLAVMILLEWISSGISPQYWTTFVSFS